MNTYDEDFYHDREDGARSSAHAIVPVIHERLAPDSVVDVGCGTGTWLGVFQEQGVSRLVGIEGEWVSSDMFSVAGAELRTADLSQPLEMNGRFDLAVSIEVAEHLPPSRAGSFVSDLCRLAPVVLFSAAVPLQGGNHHVNEQWPDYWVERFRDRGYEVVDLIRPLFWDDDRVSVWYRQNSFLFVDPEHPSAEALRDVDTSMPLSVIHPLLYLGKHRKMTKVRRLFRRLRGGGRR